MYSIKLQDGTTIDDLELNGNNFIAQEAVSDDVFKDNMKTVTISDGETEETYSDMRLMSNIVRDGRSWIVIGEKSAEEKRREAVDSSFTDIQLAMAEVYELMIGGTNNG